MNINDGDCPETDEELYDIIDNSNYFSRSEEEQLSSIDDYYENTEK